MPEFGWILQGKVPVQASSMQEWAEFFEDVSKRVVRKTALTPTIEVSTVFLGIDHSFGREDPPVLFETMVFRDGNGEEMERCSTWDEAEDMHERMIDNVCQSDGIPKPPMSPGETDQLLASLRGQFVRDKPIDDHPTAWQHLLDDEDDD